MEQLNNYDKNTIKKFIYNNELDYNIVDNCLAKFHIVSQTGLDISFFNNGNHYLISIYNVENDNDETLDEPYTYIKADNIEFITNFIKMYDDSIEKNYWEITSNSIEIGFDKESYKDNWYEDIIDDKWEVVSEDQYDIVVYDNDKIKPNIENPFYTLDSVSSIYNKKDNIIDKLYIEIHPISCTERNERYLLKLLRNNDPIFKEYTNYIVHKKKGIKKLINHLFDKYN